jgi:predicted metal-binding membrane protein
MQAVTALEHVIRRDRLVMSLGLAAIAALAWAYLARSAASMASMATDAQVHAAMGMADTRVWGLSDWLALFLMWAIMMVAMMLPSGAPVMLLVLGVYRRRGDARARLAAHAFVAGYLLAWIVFSLAAATVQLALHRAALVAPDMRLTSVLSSGLVLVVAGAYQWLPLKRACLSHCQSPLGFLSQHWQEGTPGGLTLGVRHGAFCVGCCWLLMALLLVVGVMNLIWIAALAAFVLVEKLLPGGALFGRATGVVVVVWGLYLLAFP